MSIRDDFFAAQKKAALWDVAVSLKRGNPLPIDADSIFESYEKLEEYVAGVLAYPGQVVSVVNADSTEIYYLDQNKEICPVGAISEVDGKSIVIKTDDEGEEYLSLYGFGDNYTDKEGNSKAFEAGLQLTTVADGNGGFKLAWVKPDTSTVDGLSTTVENLGGRMTTAESDIDALEAKFASLGGIFNFAGSLTEEEFGNADIDEYQVGDVVLVDGKHEYVCVEDAYGAKKWEQFGDPAGVEALTGRVTTAEGDIDNLETRATELEGKVGSAAVKNETGEVTTAASGLYLYADTVAANKADAAQTAAETTAANALAPVSEKANKNAEDIVALNIEVAKKADSDTLSTKVSELTTEINKKADSEAVDGKLALKANTEDVNGQLALKADKTTTEAAIGANTQKLGEHDTAISTLQGTVSGHGTTIGEHASTIEGHTNKIGAIETALGKVGDSTADTAFGAAAVADAKAVTAQGAAEAADAKAVAAQKTADEGVSAAGTAQSKADEAYTLAGTKVAQADYDTKVKALEDGIAANTGAASAAQSKADEAYNKADANEKNFANYSTTTEMNTAIQAVVSNGSDTKESNTIAGAKLYTDDKINTVNETITNLNNAIGNLSNIMNFVGELTVVDGVITTEGTHGDVGFAGETEYVFVDGEGWVEFGNVTAEGERLTTIEKVLNGEGETAGLIAKVGALETATSTLDTKIDGVANNTASQFETVNGEISTIKNTMATDEELAEAVKAEKDRALLAETGLQLTINNLDKAYKAADTELTNYINGLLEWGTF